jgi:hypothetical protein
VFAAIGAFFLLAEHRAHLLPYLPWLLLAACPLMHVFVHHGKHSSSRHDPASRSGSENQGGHNHA